MNNNKPYDNNKPHDNNRPHNNANTHYQIIPQESTNNSNIELGNASINRDTILSFPEGLDKTQSKGLPNGIIKGLSKGLQQPPISTIDYLKSYLPEDGEISIDERQRTGCWGFIALIIFIVIVSTVSKSFWYVQYNEYALRRNTYHGVDIYKTYTSGRYFLTLDNTMVYFHSTYQESTFTSKLFSDAGLEFDCLMTFYYKLPKNNVGKIYNFYSVQYDNVVTNSAKQVIKDISSTFSVSTFMQNRSFIEQSIGIGLEVYLNNTIGIIAPNKYFKIININFPQTLIDASLNTAIALQNNLVNLYQQNVDLITADTNSLKVDIDTQTTMVLQDATNQANELITNANSQATNIALVARSNGLKLLLNTLNITLSNNKNKLITQFSVMDNVNNITILNGLSNNVILTF